MALPSDEAYNIRTILSEMREEYWQGLAEQETEAKELLECLVFTLGGEQYAFETHYASEVIRIPKLVRVPAVQGLIVGIFNLRGEITAAMDIRTMLGLSQPEFTGSGRILVVKSENFATGIIAEAALGVQELSFENFEPAATGLSCTRRFIRGHFNAENGLIILLDLQALLASPEILVGEP
jgi:purine-binding chemotaxis protein CheW